MRGHRLSLDHFAAEAVRLERDIVQLNIVAGGVLNGRLDDDLRIGELGIQSNSHGDTSI
ncbi:hypothetical protein YSA_p00124 (plasmid) [Pseudomonas putida ND6]|uniref:Uncharacterized protein n=1 Tax=Pseudomonas putida ND6 TaxID=231023 RepID=I3V5K1_PSEPU|nr:hypothetical protein YSA_p00124 [Pseudomonas putida ND6]UVN18749.1 Hypothetical protein [Pseudomonas aeruginosa]UVN19046.1 hypothetical protein [Pseudomonas aeruginosa]